MPATMGLVLDCADPGALAAFWGPALGYTTVGGAGSYVMLLPAEGDGPQLLLQRVEEAKAGKNRIHGTHWFLMADPEDNEFCICDSGTSSG